MSNPIAPLDSLDLETVTGGTNSVRCSGTSDPLLNQLTGLANTIKDIGNASKASGFSSTDIMMLGLLMSQRNNSVVYVRRPYWW